MALSDRLTQLAARAKEAETRANAAKTEAKEDLRSDVEYVSDATRKWATELAQRSEAAEIQASDWWGQVQSDWSTHVATVRDHFATMRAEHDAERAQARADLAAADADAAIDFAMGAVEEAEYSVLEAILAEKEAVDASSGA